MGRFGLGTVEGPERHPGTGNRPVLPGPPGLVVEWLGGGGHLGRIESGEEGPRRRRDVPGERHHASLGTVGSPVAPHGHGPYGLIWSRPRQRMYQPAGSRLLFSVGMAPLLVIAEAVGGAGLPTGFSGAGRGYARAGASDRWGRPNRRWAAMAPALMAAQAHHSDASPSMAKPARMATTTKLTMP